MRISFDPAKSEKNAIERGLPFDMVADLQWGSTTIKIDTRHDYGEQRLQILGVIGERLYMVIATFRGDTVHVISLRKANKKEGIRYDEKKG